MDSSYNLGPHKIWFSLYSGKNHLALILPMIHSVQYGWVGLMHVAPWSVPTKSLTKWSNDLSGGILTSPRSLVLLWLVRDVCDIRALEDMQRMTKGEP